MSGDYNRTKVVYFGELTEKWGYPEGILPLSIEDVQKRTSSYRIDYSRKKIDRITFINVIIVQKWIKKILIVRPKFFNYAYNKDLVSVDLLDSSGKLLLKKVYRENSSNKNFQILEFKNQFKGQPAALGVASLEGEILHAEKKTNIYGYELDFYPDGKTKKILFLNIHNTPQSDNFGVWGKEFTYSPLGFCKSITNLNQEGRTSPNGKGWVTENIDRNTQNFDCGHSFFDEQGNPILGSDGYSRVAFTLDPFGNKIKEEYFGLNGKRKMGAAGYAQVVYSLDMHGKAVEISYLGPEGYPILDSKLGEAIEKRKYDSRGNMIESASYGTNGEPIFNRKGFFKRRSDFDLNGNETSGRYYDFQGVGTFNYITKNAGYVKEYDNQGRVIKQSYLNTEGKPFLSEMRGSSTWKFDEKGNIVEHNNFDLTGKLSIDLNGFAIWKQKYDQNNNLEEDLLFDVSEKPTLTKDSGVARYKWKFDEVGNMVEMSSWGLDNTPTLDKKMRVFKHCSKFDSYGNKIEYHCLNRQGDPCINSEGYSAWANKFDDRGRVTETRYYGTHGELIQNKTGVAIWKSSYDVYGNEISGEFFGSMGEPVLNNKGYAKWSSEFDDRGRVVTSSFYGIDGKPVVSADGYARQIFKFSKEGRLIETLSYGTDGNLIRSKTLYASVSYRYDSRGNRVEEAFFDAEGHAFQGPDGAVKVKYEYDDRGKILECFFATENGAPYMVKNKYSKILYKYNSLGKVSEFSFKNNKDEFCLGSQGFAKKTMRFDDQENEVEVCFYDASGGLVLCPDLGFAKKLAKYDVRGNEVEAQFYGTDKKLVLNIYGLAYIFKKYDARDNLIEKSYAGLNAEPIIISEKYAFINFKYDEFDQKIEESYSGLSRDPVLCLDGYAKIKLNYDERGNVIETKFSGLKGEPINNKNGVFYLKCEYDAMGHMKKSISFNRQGKLVKTAPANTVTSN